VLVRVLLDWTAGAFLPEDYSDLVSLENSSFTFELF
jgi:hypothetical protein